MSYVLLLLHATSRPFCLTQPPEHHPPCHKPVPNPLCLLLRHMMAWALCRNNRTLSDVKLRLVADLPPENICTLADSKVAGPAVKVEASGEQ